MYLLVVKKNFLHIGPACVRLEGYVTEGVLPTPLLSCGSEEERHIDGKSGVH